MRRNSLVAILAFVAGLGIGYFVRGAMGTANRPDTYGTELAGIEKLHRADIEATLTQEMSALSSVWSVYSYDDLPARQTDPEMTKFSLREDQKYVIPILITKNLFSIARHQERRRSHGQVG